MKVSVLGAGAFGTALAISLSRQGQSVTLWARDLANMVDERENTRRLPGFPFPESLKVTDLLSEATDADALLLATPMQSLSQFLAENAGLLDGKILVACCKGVDLKTGLGPAQIIGQTCPSAIPAILSGPSFAVDIAGGLPTALTLAVAGADPLQEVLSTANIRLYRSTDLTGVALGGALKNVIAIACGIAVGAGLGESAHAALMTRGFAEMQRFALSRGARSETLSGLSGFGDLVLTCSSNKSRNFSYGLALGRGAHPPEGTTVEGKATAIAVSNLAKMDNIEMPVTDMVVAVIDKKLTIEEAVAILLSRPLKEE